MVAELVSVGLIYIGAAIGMMFLIPYWMVDLRAPLPSALEHRGFVWGKIIVTVGPMFGITNLQMLGLYGLSRSIYRMSKDGLIFSFFLSVDSRTGVPQRAVVFAGVFTSVFALLCDLSYIVKMSLILMLASYISVAAALICLKIGKNNNAAMFISSHGNDEGYSLFPEGDEETLFSREVESSSKLVFSSDFEENKTTNKPLKMETSMFLCNSIEDIDALEAFDAYTQETIRKSSPPIKSGQLHYNQSLSHNNPERDLEKDHSKEFCLLNAQHKKVQNVGPEEDPFLMQKDGEAHSSPEVSTMKQFPGVPTNILILLHLVTCVTLSGQVIYGKDDLLTLRLVAMLACGMLVVLLVLFSTLLWLLYSRGPGAQRKDHFFQVSSVSYCIPLSLLSLKALSSSNDKF